MITSLHNSSSSSFYLNIYSHKNVINFYVYLLISSMTSQKPKKKRKKIIQNIQDNIKSTILKKKPQYFM